MPLSTRLLVQAALAQSPCIDGIFAHPLQPAFSDPFVSQRWFRVVSHGLLLIRPTTDWSQDRTLANIPVATYSSSTNLWFALAADAGRIFSFFSIGKCSIAESSDDCPVLAGILSSPIDYSQVDSQLSATPNHGSWTKVSASEQVRLGLHASADAGLITGMQFTVMELQPRLSWPASVLAPASCPSACPSQSMIGFRSQMQP